MNWKSVAFWDEKWREAKAGSLYGQRQRGVNHVRWWDQRAKGFADRYGESQKNDPKTNILAMIQESGLVDPEAELLDIGCGPGNYAIPLAGRFKKIVALDASPKMLSILEARAEAEGIKNIETVCASWEDVDIDGMGWRGRFGMVLAIKSPAIRDAESLRKMIDVSGGGCLYNGFILREDGAQANIWRRMFDEDLPPVCADAFYVYHLVHALGYLPCMKLRRHFRESRENVAAARRELSLLMAPYEDPSGRMDQVIHQYVMEMSVGGEFSKICHSEEGTISWSV